MPDLQQRVLSHYPVLASIPSTDLDAALRNARPVELNSGSVVFEELQTCNAYPFVLRGAVKVVKRSANGRELTLYHLTTGDACVISTACLLGEKPYNAIGLVQADCELVMLPAQDFNRLLSFQAFRDFMFSLFSRRVLDLMMLIDEVAFRKLDQRLAQLLLNHAPTVTASHQELADELGTVREMITRTLSSFSDRRLVRLNRGRVEVLDPRGLERLLAG